MATILHLRCPDRLGGHPSFEHRSILLIDEVLGQVARSLGRIAADEDAGIELSLLSSKLLNLVAAMEREPSIESAADALYEAARRVVRGTPGSTIPQVERLQRIGSAYTLLRKRVLTAQPRVEETA